MNYSTYQHIQIDVIGGIQHLKALEIEITPNQHGKANFTAIIDQTNKFDFLEKQLQEQPVKITDSNQGVIFAGYPDQFEVEEVNGLYQLTAQVCTGTIKLDQAVKSRSYQDSKMLYREVVSDVISDTPQAASICTVGINEPIGKPVIQYNETDWAFCKRLASHFGAMLIPEVTEAMPRFWFGMRKGKAQEAIFDETDYIVKKDYGAYLINGGQSAGLRERDFFTYRVKSSQNYLIGETTTYKQKQVTICAKQITLENGLLIYTYTLGFPKGFGLKRYGNNSLHGAAIQGTVIKRQTEQLKVHLSIDKSQESEKAFWYNYIPLTGNQLYDMPIEGTTVNLFFGDSEESSAHVTDCVRLNGRSCAETSDNDNRYLTTEHGKKIALKPDTLSLSGGKNSVSITDKTGIAFNTNRVIKLSAGGNINISAKSVKINGKEKIGLAQEKHNSQFVIENKFDSMGKKGLFKTGGAGAEEAPEEGASSTADVVAPIMCALGGLVR